MGFDGSSVRGFAEINESDLMLIADMSTIRSLTSNVTMIPGYKVTSVIADVYRGFGQGRLSKDPRYVSGCMEDHHLKQKGLVCQIGAEVECFIFDDIAFNDLKDNEEPKIISVEHYGQGKYPIRTKEGYEVPPFQDSLSAFRFEVAEILTKYYDIDVTNLIHEVASMNKLDEEEEEPELEKVEEQPLVASK